MNPNLTQFALTAFGPLLAMINPIAVTSGMSSVQWRDTLTRSVVAASGVALFFLFVGRAFSSYMGVSVQAFAISGEIPLFVIAFPMLMGQRSLIQAPPTDHPTVGWPWPCSIFCSRQQAISGLDNTLLDEPLQRFIDGLQRGIARAIIEETLRFGDACIGTVRDVIPGLRRVFF